MVTKQAKKVPLFRKVRVAFGDANKWNYACGWCRIFYLGVGADKTAAESWREEHERTGCARFGKRPLLTRRTEVGYKMYQHGRRMGGKGQQEE